MIDTQTRALGAMMRWHVIPERFRIAARTPDTNRQAIHAVNEALPILYGEGGCLALSGTPGCGKSFALYYAACLMMERKREDVLAGKENPSEEEWYYAGLESQMIVARVMDSRDLVAASMDDSEWNHVKREMRGLLGIDDLGAEHVSDSGWSANKAEELMDYRYMHRLPTIITTNLSFTGAPSEFEKRYGARVVDRLREWGRVVPLTDKSLRGA